MPAPAEAGRTRALQYRFAGYLRDPEHAPPLPDVERRRLDLYAELVFNNVEELLAANFPVIRSLHDDAAWQALVRGFLAKHRAQTPLFLEIGREFQRYLQARQEADAGDPPFLVELAHYEWAELALSIDEHELDGIAHDPDGDPLHGVPVVSPLAWCFGYRFPVHTIRPDFRPDVAPEQPTFLLLVRDRNDGVSFIEVNPLTALLLQRLQENGTDTGLECLRALLAETGNAGDAGLIEGGTAVLQELRDREAILGTAL